MVVDVETREPLEVGKDLEGELCIRGPQVWGEEGKAFESVCVYVCVLGTTRYTLHTTRLAAPTHHTLNTKRPQNYTLLHTHTHTHTHTHARTHMSR